MMLGKAWLPNKISYMDIHIDSGSHPELRIRTKTGHPVPVAGNYI